MKELLNIKGAIVISILLHFGYTIHSQSYINVSGNFNYWKHTELFGPGIGFGYSYKHKRFTYSINYDFGYGTINRFKKITGINYDQWSTVFIKQDQGKWNDYLILGGITNVVNVSSDYGKQHQVSLQLNYPIIQHNDLEFSINSGIYSAVVEQFYTFTVVPIHNILLPTTYSGPLNYIPSTLQKIFTYGLNIGLSVNKSSGSKIWSPYIMGGIGPNQGSYISLGLKLSTMLRKKS
ncbi:MAG: hypothetical protein IPK35_04090 [Saprospiraceae bacterium]|jgi:hypothetical protein|nr:hypothetical protein [Saprospiraceae bacterium]